MNYQDLRSQYKQLREELAKLKPPVGLEDLDRPFSAVVTANPPAGSSSQPISTAAAEPLLPQPSKSSAESTQVTPMQISPKPNSTDATDGPSTCEMVTAPDVPMSADEPASDQSPNTTNTTPVVEADAPSDASSTVENMLTDETTTHYNEWWSGA